MYFPSKAVSDVLLLLKSLWFSNHSKSIAWSEPADKIRHVSHALQRKNKISHHWCMMVVDGAHERMLPAAYSRCARATWTSGEHNIQPCHQQSSALVTSCLYAVTFLATHP